MTLTKKRAGLLFVAIAVCVGAGWLWYSRHTSDHFVVRWGVSGEAGIIECVVRDSEDRPVPRQAVWFTNDTDSLGGYTDANGHLRVQVEGEGPIWKMKLPEKGSVTWNLLPLAAGKGLRFEIQLKRVRLGGRRKNR